MIPAELIPKRPGQPLQVVVIGRISTVHQREESVDASMTFARQRLRSMYSGEIHFTMLGEQASGTIPNRMTICQAETMIEQGDIDLVITEDLSRIYREPQYLLGFIHKCLDHDTRVMAFGDGFDTGKEDWEALLGFAAARHGLTVPETRRRVKNNAAFSFAKGGMVQKIRYGYRKLTKQEAASGQFGPQGLRVAKDETCNLIILELVNRRLAGESYPQLAEWLNESGIPPGAYVSSKIWTKSTVRLLLNDPILYGQRRFGVTNVKRKYGTGQKSIRKNPIPQESSIYSELAHISRETFELLRKQDAELASDKSILRGREHPLFNRPRGDSIFPAKHVTCGICGHQLYVYDKHQLKCSHAAARNVNKCWNHVQVDCRIAREKLIVWMIQQFENYPHFRESLVDAVFADLQHTDSKRKQQLDVIDRQIRDQERQAENYGKAIGQGEISETILRLLVETEKRIAALQLNRNEVVATENSEHAFLSKEAIAEQLQSAMLGVASTSTRFALFMRRVMTQLEIIPIQAIDSGLVRPRAHITLSIKLPLPETNPAEVIQEIHGELDLFDPPQHIKHMQVCVDMKHNSPELSLKKIEKELGIGHMTVKRAFGIARHMEREGLNEPYRKLSSPPTNASRWKVA